MRVFGQIDMVRSLDTSSMTMICSIGIDWSKADCRPRAPYPRHCMS